ncbi:MAG: Hsp70 family protein [Acetatifactor sp.]|nr:Hsp70 family protein [Acetatifactor sp.]
MSIIGIDLGTSNTLACVFRDGEAVLIPNGEGGYLTKSAVSVMEDGTIITGRAAKERLLTHPDRTAASYKVFMGTEWETCLGQQYFKPEELSAFVLRQIKQDAEKFLQEPVEEAVISVPAYFNDNQRCATKLAAQLAGLKVSRLINEPSAAAVYYRWNDPDAEDGKLMIVDFGGGTLDVSIVECFDNIIEILCIAGDNHLGGDDIDAAIAKHFCEVNHLAQAALTSEEKAALMRQAENAKTALSEPEAENTLMKLSAGEKEYMLNLDRELLAELCEPVFKRVEKVLRRALENKKAARGIRRVVLVGGSSRMPVFHDFLEKLMSARPVIAADPDKIVALGAGVCAGIKERREELQDIVMTDVCPFSLGVATYNSQIDREPHMAVLIPRSSMLPVSHSSRFYTLHDGQEHLRFEFYQGEDYFVSGNLKLGELKVRVPRGIAGSQWAEVVFTYDINGILHVSVESSGGDKRETVILNPNLHLTDEEMKEAMERINSIRLTTEAHRDEQLFAQALSLYERLGDERRAALSRGLELYCGAQDAQDIIAVRRAEEYLKELVERFRQELSEDPFEQLYGLGMDWDEDTEEPEDE